MTDTKRSADYLRPCPICGGADLYLSPDEWGSGGQWVYPLHAGCKTCALDMVCPGDSEGDAIAAWNTRANSPEPLRGWRETLEAHVELLRRQEAAITGTDIALIREDGGLDLAKRVVNLKGAAQWVCAQFDSLLISASPNPPQTEEGKVQGSASQKPDPIEPRQTPNDPFSFEAQLAERLNDPEWLAKWNTAEEERLPFVALLHALRRDEGDSVTLLSDNPDFNGQPNNAIECCGAWTDWRERRFTGDTLHAAVLAAYRARITVQPDAEPTAPLQQVQDGSSDGTEGR